MMNVYLILKKELGVLFSSSIFYGVITIFCFLSGYFFYTDLSLYNNINLRGIANPVQGFWWPYFNDLRFIFMLLMPLLTMRHFAEEKRLGTFELITTYPLKDGEIVAGKFLASLIAFFVMLALTGIHVLLWGALWGFWGLMPLLAGYLGLVLLGCSLIACGLFISSLTENQAMAGMATLGLFIFFWFLTWNELMANEKIMSVLVRFSLFDRMQGFFKGYIDTKDVVFFALFIAFFLLLNLRSLESRFWRGK